MIDEEIIKRVHDFRLMDDIFFNTVMQDNKECMEYILNVIMDREDLKVNRIETQMDIPGIFARGVRFDVFCTDNEGKEYDFEVQNSDVGAVPKRARYNSSMMDYLHLKTGEDWNALPKVTVIMLAEKDVLAGAKPIYHIFRTIKEMNQVPFEDGTDIIYVNGSYRDKTTRLGQLIEDFHCSNPEHMNSEILKSRASFIKNNKEKVNKMCKSVEEYAEMKAREVAKAVTKAVTKEVTENVTKKVAKESDEMNAWLVENNRIDEMIKSFTDSAMKEKLVTEYHAAHRIN